MKSKFFGKKLENREKYWSHLALKSAISTHLHNKMLWRRRMSLSVW